MSGGDRLTGIRDDERVAFADLGRLHAPLRDELDKAVAQTLDDSAFIGGERVTLFEAEWAQYCGTKAAVGVANGTDALFLILSALGIGAGDEVLVPANTFVASAEAVAMAGATPVFVDVDPVSLVVTPETLAPALTARTTAVMPVHLYGHMADMDALSQFAERHGLALVEDAAQAHGARWKGRAAGSFGVASGFSFYPGKNLGALGDAGAVVTDRADIAERVRSLSNHGRGTGDHYVHPRRGVNSRLDAIQAACLSVKLRKLDEWTRLRRGVADKYLESLGAHSDKVVRPQGACESAWHLFVLRVDDRVAFRRRLDHAGVDTGIHYPVPCHEQQAYAAAHRRDVSLPVAEAAAREVVSLPFHPYLGDYEIARVVDAVLRAFH